jgi:hypothetical protein
MTKKLEDLLNLPDSKEIIKQAEVQEAEQTKHEMANVVETFRDIEEFDKIAKALPAIKGLGKMADDELNEIADKAMQAYDDLMDLGMNVESRHSGRVFETAGGMLKTSLDAKVAKLDKKLKMVELQLKKQAIDQKNNANPDGDVVNGDGYVVTDRNSLLEKLKNMDK